MQIMGTTYSVLFFIMLLVSSCLSEYSKKYVARPGMKLIDTYVTEQPDVLSKVECVSSCTSRVPCRSASWSTDLQQCLLSNQDVAVKWSLYTTHRALEANTGWATLGEIFYPVAHFVGVNGQYSLSFAQAQQVCLDHGTVLASPAQLLQARAMGFSYCACGWLSDETNGFVLQVASWQCWGSYNTGILYCGFGKANAWCAMQ